ncbi:predicted protein [Naegleria gruberi]|uniref:ADP/ATP translocase n=1 Tax=Naegleria gruberi TaxID=5762 RepID=D2W0G9_NAEGR|nr:uncharacterized protein NAEGRDRAFT_74855 [Naegleria gruberi]EFC37476.1 predicted protein [Naegleria gruberi]|eukprot:XP_002670220.1 predicted protein [Naegleria gruberi strain NEG-M]
MNNRENSMLFSLLHPSHDSYDLLGRTSKSGRQIPDDQQVIEQMGLNFVIGSSASVLGKMISTPIQCLSVLGRQNYWNTCVMNAKMFGSILFKFAPSQALALSLKDGFSELLMNRVNVRFASPFVDESNRIEYLKFVGVQFSSGALAGAVSHCILHPMEMAQLKYHHYLSNHQVMSQFKGPMDFALKTNGFFKLFNGFGMFSMHSIIYRAFLFGTFDSLKVINPYQDETNSLGILSKILLAQAATCISTFFSIPFLNARREMITLQQSNLPITTRSCLKSLYSNSGFRGLFNGFVSQSLLHRSSGTAILVCYDLLQQYLSSRV